jgi:hypothetical protein
LAGYYHLIPFYAPFAIAVLLGWFLIWGTNRSLSIVGGLVGVSLMAMGSVGWLGKEHLMVGTILFAAAMIARSQRP